MLYPIELGVRDGPSWRRGSPPIGDFPAGGAWPPGPSPATNVVLTPWPPSIAGPTTGLQIPTYVAPAGTPPPTALFRYVEFTTVATRLDPNLTAATSASTVSAPKITQA